MTDDGIKPSVVTYSIVISKAPDFETAQVWLNQMQAEGIPLTADTYGNLISKSPDYATAEAWLNRMKEEGIRPTVVTYDTLMSKSPDYATAEAWLKEMKAAGKRPNTLTYNTLISKSPDYGTAEAWLKEMKAAGKPPNTRAYNTLISKAPDYATAGAWLNRMKEEGIRPDVVTYSRLFSLNLSGKSADELLSWYLSEVAHPERPIQAAIASYRKAGLTEEALRLALDYPHLQAARKLIRENADMALSYFQRISENDPNNPNAEYALGVSLMELGRTLEARPHLSRALTFARPGPRRKQILKWLEEIPSGME